MKKNLTFLLFGILAAIGAVIISCTPVSAQTIDTNKTVPVHYGELVKILQQIQRAQSVYHRMDISALKRDTIDSYLGDVANFFNKRANVVYSDTVKKGKGK